MFATASHR